jgi:hypothetical protein
MTTIDKYESVFGVEGSMVAIRDIEKQFPFEQHRKKVLEIIDSETFNDKTFNYHMGNVDNSSRLPFTKYINNNVLKLNKKKLNFVAWLSFWDYKTFIKSKDWNTFLDNVKLPEIPEDDDGEFHNDGANIHCCCGKSNGIEKSIYVNNVDTGYSIPIGSTCIKKTLNIIICVANNSTEPDKKRINDCEKIKKQVQSMDKKYKTKKCVKKDGKDILEKSPEFVNAYLNKNNTDNTKKILMKNMIEQSIYPELDNGKVVITDCMPYSMFYEFKKFKIKKEFIDGINNCIKSTEHHDYNTNDNQQFSSVIRELLFKGDRPNNFLEKLLQPMWWPTLGKTCCMLELRKRGESALIKTNNYRYFTEYYLEICKFIKNNSPYKYVSGNKLKEYHDETNTINYKILYKIMEEFEEEDN